MKNVKMVNIGGHMVIIHSSTDGGFVARIPSLHGTVTQGETLKEAVAMARDAIEGFREDRAVGRIAVVPKVKGFLKREVLLGILKQADLSQKDFMKLL